MRKMLFDSMLFGLLASTVLAQAPPAGAPPAAQPQAGAASFFRSAATHRPGYATSSDPRQTNDLLERWRLGSATERDRVETELREKLKSEFTARLAAHEREIKDLEAKVRELRDRLNLRREKQDEIVDHRLQQLLREAQGLGWGSEVQGRGYGWVYGEAGMEGEYGRGYGGRGGYGTYSSAGDVPMSAFAPQTAPSALAPETAAAPSPSSDLVPTRNDLEPSPARN